MYSRIEYFIVTLLTGQRYRIRHRFVNKMHAVHYFYPLNRLSNHCTWKRNQMETRRSVCWKQMVLASRVSGYCKSSDLTLPCCSVFEIKPSSAPMMRFWKKNFTARFVVLTGAGILCTTLKLANEEWRECILICFQVWYCFCKWLGLQFLVNQYASKPSWYRFVEVPVSNPVDLVFVFVGWLGAENMKRHWDDWNQHVKLLCDLSLRGITFAWWRCLKWSCTKLGIRQFGTCLVMSSARISWNNIQEIYTHVYLLAGSEWCYVFFSLHFFGHWWDR